LTAKTRGATRRRGNGSRKRNPRREGDERPGLGSRRKAGLKKPLRAFGFIAGRMLVGRFRDPEAAFLAAEGLELRETVGSWNGPRKPQGTAAARAGGMKQRNVAGRQHYRRAHHGDTLLSYCGGRARKTARAARRLRQPRPGTRRSPFFAPRTGLVPRQAGP
jgi:hypothetical protein